jgi:hypothetical protein
MMELLLQNGRLKFPIYSLQGDTTSFWGMHNSVSVVDNGEAGSKKAFTLQN